MANEIETNSDNPEIDAQFRSYLGEILRSPSKINKNSPQYVSLMNNLRFAADPQAPGRVLAILLHVLNVSSMTLNLPTITLPMIESLFMSIGQLNDRERNAALERFRQDEKVGYIVDSAFLNRVRTADRQQRAVNSFIKG
ncbi:MAG: hypothetical protein ABJA02_07530 [Acidobacteriota bacterium]